VRIERILRDNFVAMLRFLCLAAFALGSCSQTPAPGPKKAPPKDPAAMSGWHQLALPVQNGRRIPCAKMLPDEKAVTAAFGPALTTAHGAGATVTIADDASSDGDATTVCSIKLGGKQVSAAEQKAKFAANNMNLGVLPGDEICSLRVYCWYAFDAASMKHQCDDKHMEGSADIGDYTCIDHKFAGDHQRAVVDALDPDTKCKMSAHAGPSEFDDNVVKACAKAAVDLIGPPQIAP
jgi:hypothetical protein